MNPVIQCYAASVWENPVNDWNCHWRCYTEGGSGLSRNGNILFLGADKSDVPKQTDWVLVLDAPCRPFSTFTPKQRRVLFIGEPPGICRYDLEYLEQFGIVISPYDIPQYSAQLRIENTHWGWFAGRGIGHGGSEAFFSKLSDVLDFPLSKKKRKISVISSLKKKFIGHQKRLLFLKALMERFGDTIDYYGREFAPVKDKLDAIAPYEYHITIENTILKNYWTEKLTDAWIGWSLPIYSGDPAIQSKVPNALGIEIIDVNDIAASLQKIDNIINSNDYADRIEAIKSCREWAVRELNPFEKMAQIITSADRDIQEIPFSSEPCKITFPQKYKKSFCESIREKIESHRGKRLACKIQKMHETILNGHS